MSKTEGGSSPARLRRIVGIVGVVAALGAVLLGTTGAPVASANGGPELAVTPSTGLDPEGQDVTVDGTGYTAGQGVYVQYCKQPDATPGSGAAGRATHCDPAQANQRWINPIDEDGSFSTTVPVTPTIVKSGVTVDCQVEQCGIFTRRDHVGGGSDFSSDRFTPISFQAPASPTLVVDPSTDIDRDGQTVTVNGSGYTPGLGVYVQYCEAPAGTPGEGAAGRATHCDPAQANQRWVNPIGQDGTFSVELPITPAITKGEETVDCLDGGCGIFTRRDHNGGATDFSLDAYAPVTFADDPGPQPGTPTLTADQTTGLDPAGETITVQGTGFLPGIELYVAECDAAVAAGGACNMASFKVAPVAEDGTFTAEVTVQGQFGSGATATDCKADGAQCAIQTSRVGQGSDRTQEATLPISFGDGPGPGPGPEQVVPAVSVSGDAVPGGTMTATFTGFAPESGVEVWLHSTPVKVGDFLTDAQGVARVTVVLPADLEVGPHQIEGRGIDADGDPVTATVSFTVTAATSTTTAAPAGTSSRSGSLPVTGTSVTLLVVAGLAVLGGGAALVLAGRRRTAR